MPTPFVSIVIPVLNGQKTLRSCLESVCNQDYPSYEVIVVDNNSTDQTKKIIHSFQEQRSQVKYIFEPLQRRGAARCSGEQRAAGEIILMTDADCIVPSGWITAMIAPIVSKEQVAVQGITKPINVPNYWADQYQQEKESLWQQRQSDHKIGLLDTANFAIKRNVLQEVGYSNPKFDYANDAELMVRLILKGYRIHFREVAVLHHNPDNVWQLLNKNFSRGQWDYRMRTVYYVYSSLFISWTSEDEKLFWQSLCREFKVKKPNALYALVSGIGWRLGSFWESLRKIGNNSEPGEYKSQSPTIGINSYIPLTLPQSLPGSLWGITTYFNPGQYKNKLVNYQRFRAASKKQGLKLLTVELVFGEMPFELTSEKADILIQRRADSVMWQKERLLNIALQNLPPDCDKVVWLDADIIFKNDNWINETAQGLELYQVIQPFQHVLMLPPGVSDAAEGILWRDNFQSSEFMGKACKILQPIRSDTQDFGHPGFAWAARRDWLQKVGFYDKLILGWGDYLMAAAFYQECPTIYNTVSSQLVKDAQSWAQKTYEFVQGSVSFIPGNILHLWHGERAARLYKERLKILSKYQFTPEDIRLNVNECWEWATPKKKLHNWIAGYFKRRNEEGSAWNAILAAICYFWDFKKGTVIKDLIRNSTSRFRSIVSLSRWVITLIAVAIIFVWNILKEKFKRMILIVSQRVDWAIGQVGLFLKERIPVIYYFLKGQKNGSS